jgi:competence protein ComEC
MEGVVVNDPEVRGRSIKLVVEGSLADHSEATGKVLVWAMPSSDLIAAREEPFLRYGDRLGLEGTLDKPAPFGDFDYAEYLAQQGIGSVMSHPRVVLLDEGHGSPVLKAVYAFRHRLSRSLAASLPGEQAALAQALLLGLRADVPEKLTGAFRSTGTSHIMAISGLHVGVLLALALGLGTWLLGKKRNIHLVLPLLAVWSYALLAGFSASAERAAIMGTVYLAALALGRQRSVLPALALAAGVMVGMNRSQLHYRHLLRSEWPP